MRRLKSDFAAVLDRVGLVGQTTFDRVGGFCRRRLVVDLASAAADEEVAEALGALVEAAPSYKVVLTERRFIEGVGFRLGEDDTEATLIEIDLDVLRLAGRPLVLSLAWRCPPCLTSLA